MSDADAPPMVVVGVCGGSGLFDQPEAAAVIGGCAVPEHPVSTSATTIG